MANSRPPFYIAGMDSKRKPRQSPSNPPRQTETQLALLPDDEGLPKKLRRGGRLPDGPEESRAVECTASPLHKASPQFLKRMGWSAQKWEEIRKHWLEGPDDDTKRDWLLYTTAKYERYRAAPKLAIERQKELHSTEWMVAFLLAQGWNRKGIADALILSDVDYVDKIIHAIKIKADVKTQGGVVRWFLGL